MFSNELLMSLGDDEVVRFLYVMGCLFNKTVKQFHKHFFRLLFIRKQSSTMSEFQSHYHRIFFLIFLYEMNFFNGSFLPHQGNVQKIRFNGINT